MRRTSHRPQLMRAAACASIFLLAVSAARATNVTVTVWGTDGVSNWNNEILIPVLPDDTFSLSGGTSMAGGWEVTSIEIAGDVDPFVDFGFVVKNTIGVPVDFNMSISVPVSVNYSSSLVGGSVGITLTDANFNGSTSVSTTGVNPIYVGRLDGVDELSLFPAAYSLSTGVVGDTTVDSMVAGLPGPTIPAGPLSSTMEVVLRFTLSPGDLVGMTGFFIAVPEPSSMALVVVGLVGLTGYTVIRRRR